MKGKAKSRQELAEEYGISPKTFSRWLKKENIEIVPGLLTIKEQELIYATFGRPLSKKQQ